MTRSLPLPAMHRVGCGARRRPKPLPVVLQLITLLGGLALLITPAAAGAGWGASSSWSPAAVAWGNSLVTCNFTVQHPGIAMASPSDRHSGLSAAIGTFREMAPNGSRVAAVALSTANWTVLNLSNATSFRLGYLASAPVVSSSGNGPALGNASFRIEFTLESYTSSGAPDGASVAMTVDVSHWPWSAPTDTLAVTLPVWPTFADAEHLLIPPPGAFRVTSASNATGGPLEYIAVDAMANVTTATGRSATIVAIPQTSIRPESGTITITFGPQSGNYRTLSYHATLGLVRPSSVAGVPLYEFALVGGASAGLSLALAAGVRRLRRSPPSLVYVEEGP